MTARTRILPARKSIGTASPFPAICSAPRVAVTSARLGSSWRTKSVRTAIASATLARQGTRV